MLYLIPHLRIRFQIKILESGGGTLLASKGNRFGTFPLPTFRGVMGFIDVIPLNLSPISIFYQKFWDINYPLHSRKNIVKVSDSFIKTVSKWKSNNWSVFFKNLNE